MTRIVRMIRIAFVISVSGFLHHHSFAQDAQSYYISNVDPDCSVQMYRTATCQAGRRAVRL